MEIQYSFKPDEVMQDFKLIGETFMRNIVRTGRGKRMYQQMIVDKGYDEDAKELIAKGKYAYSQGLKSDVVLTSQQIRVLKELVIYCVGL